MNRLLSRVPLQYKLMLVGILPFVFLVVLAFRLHQVNVQKLSTLENYVVRLEGSAEINELIDALRMERRYSFQKILTSDSTADLSIYRARTDSHVNRLSINEDLHPEFARYTFLEQLPEMRKAIDSGRTTHTIVVDYFTNLVFRFNTLNPLPAFNKVDIGSVHDDLVSQKILSDMITYMGLISANVYTALLTGENQVAILFGTRGIYIFYRSFETELLIKSAGSAQAAYKAQRSSPLHSSVNDYIDRLFSRFQFDSTYDHERWVEESSKMIDEMRALQQTVLEGSMDRIRQIYDDKKTSNRITILAIAVILLFVVTLMFFVLRNISRMLRGLESAAGKIAQGEENVEVDLYGRDAIGSLARSIRDLEQKVTLRTRQLQAANREMESFSYSVSHDLRAPLRAITGYSTMLEEDHGRSLNDEAKRLTLVIRTNAIRMGQLIDDLLSFSRLGRQEIVKTWFNTGELVSEVMRELPGSGDHQWKIGELPASFGDRNTIRQVWINLMSNAIKFSGKSGPSQIQITGERTGNETVFCVKDFGAGFDEKFKDKLFRVFQRLHHQKDFEGTGIGLAIVEKIITKHGGRVWASSKTGEGTCFYFTLPHS